MAKILLHYYSPFPLAFLRFVFASAMILPFFLKHIRSSKQRLSIKEILPIALLSTTNVALFYFGLTRTTNNASATIYASVPLITAILAQHTLKEIVSGKKIAGIILGFIGVMTILVLPLFERGEAITGEIGGNLLIVIASFTWAFYTVGSRHLITNKGYSPLVITSISIFTSALVFAVFTLVFFPMDYISPLFVGNNLILILHLSLMVTVTTLLLYQWAIKHSSAATASLSNYLQPVFSILLGIVILSEPITGGFLIGSGGVFLGIFLATGTQLKQHLTKWYHRKK
ncbi:MAG: DMT family transporter [Patescibacteria group bacterium]